MTDVKEVQYEIIDERTGEIIPKGSPALTEQRTLLDINKVGTLSLSTETLEVLGRKLDENEVQIRPDGLVYLPWTWFAKRLNEAFGVLQWGLVPQGAPQSRGVDEVLVVWGNWLVVRGVPVGFAYGETTYRANNKGMSYADACEGAKSISLARNCKVLGMALELWDADWTSQWKRNHAEQYENDRGYKNWRKRNGKPASQPSPNPVVKAQDEAGEESQEEPKLSLKSLREYETVGKLANASGKKKSDIVKYISTLTSPQTTTEVLAGLKGLENVAQ